MKRRTFITLLFLVGTKPSTGSSRCRSKATHCGDDFGVGVKLSLFWSDIA